MTRWALTSGIVIKTGRIVPASSGSTRYFSAEGGVFVVYGKEAFDTAAEAKKRVREMIINKKKAIAMQLKKLDELDAKMGAT